jgi:lysozyme
MKTSASGRAFIEAFEGLYLGAYLDSAGVLTIGYGHTSAAGGPKVVKGQRITKAQADELLASDLTRVEQDVERDIRIPLAQCEFDALVSFQFNTGALRSGSVDDKLNRGDKKGAMKTLLLYTHAGGKVLSGLVRRRKAEKLMFDGDRQAALAMAGVHQSLTIDPIGKAERKPRASASVKAASAGGGAVAAAVAAQQQGLPWWSVLLTAAVVGAVIFAIIHNRSK